MKYKLKTIVLGLFGAVAVLGVMVLLNELGSGRINLCFKDSLVCTLEEIEDLRDERDAITDANNEMVSKINADTVEVNKKYDDRIEEKKLKLPASFVSEMIEKEIYKDVPKSILRKVLDIPEAKADATKPGDISLNTEAVKSFSVVTPIDTEPAQNRYTAVLAKYNAPYKNVNIEKYCNDASMLQRDCDVMVAIAQQESQMGKDFHCVQQTKAYAITLGQTYYHNPMGLSDAKVHYKNYKQTGKKNADFQGCFIRKFDSWEDFWRFMPQSFMDKSMRYYVGNWNTVEELSGIWVNGKKSSPSEAWYKTVKSVLNSGTLTTK